MMGMMDSMRLQGNGKVGSAVLGGTLPWGLALARLLQAAQVC